MARHHGGEQVKAGFFFNLNSWEIRTVSGTGGGTLDGDASIAYLRVPALVMLLIAPLLGALFAIFLPFIGIALVAGHVALRAWNGVRGVAHFLVVSLGPAWQPSATHLVGTPAAKKQDAAATGDATTHPALDALEREIERRAEDDAPAPRR